MTRLSRYAITFKSFYTGKYAIVANTITAGGMGFLADTVSQTVEKNVSNKPWEFDRTKNMTILSTSFGPLVHIWYRFLDNRYAGKSRLILAKKVGVDLAIAPIWYALYVAGLCQLKSGSTQDTLTEYKEKVPLLIAADLLFWPILQSLNFIFFPPHYRIIGLKLNELAMGILTSHVVNNDYSFKETIERVINIKK